MATSQLNIRIPTDVHAGVLRAARVSGKSLQEYVSRALSDHLKAAAQTATFAGVSRHLDVEILRLSRVSLGRGTASPPPF